MMEKLPENNPVQADGSAVTPAVSLGKMLREARERAGLSVADMAHQIKFAPRQIEALEADDFQHLPEMAFVRGFVRSYAKILNLDAQPLLEALPRPNVSPMPLMPASVEVPYPVATSPQLYNLIWLGAALLLAVLVVAFAVWHFTTPVVQPEMTQVETPVALPSQMQIIPASPVAETGVMEPTVAAMTQPASVAAQSSIQSVKPSVAQSHEAPYATVGKVDALTQTQPTKPLVQPAILPQPQPVKSVLQPAVTSQIQQAKPIAKPDAIPQAQSAKPAAPPQTQQTKPVTLPVASPQTQQTKPAALPVASPQTQQTKPATLPVASSQTQSDKPATPSAKSPTTLLHLAFDEESWVEIKDKEGNIVSSQINPRGSELRLNVPAPFSLVVGHAASVHVYHRGKQVDLKPHTNSSSEVARLTLE